MKNLPEEVQMSILHLVQDEDLLRCAEVSRSLNRLAVQLGLEKERIRDATYSCTIKIRSYSRTPSALSFLLVSAHIKSFQQFTLSVVCSGEAHHTTFVLKRLRRLTEFLEKTEIKDTIHMNMPVSAMNWIMESPGETDGSSRATGKALEHLLDVATSKSTQRLWLYDWSETTISGWKLRDNEEEEILTSSSVKEDELQYVTKDSTISLQYRPKDVLTSRSNLEDREFGASIQWLRPPLSQWIFSYLEAVPPSSFTLLADVPIRQREIQFILSRVASLSGLRSLFLVVHLPSILPAFMSGLRFFAHTLQYLTIHADARDKECVSGLHHVEFPELVRIVATASVLQAIFSAKNHLRMPKLQSVLIYAVDDRTYGEPFNIASFAGAIVATRRSLQTAFIQPQATPSNPEPGSTDDGLDQLTSTPPPKPITSPNNLPLPITANVEFLSNNFGALTQDLRRGVPPELKSEELTNALKKIPEARIMFNCPSPEIQQGKRKEEMLAFVTAFSGLKNLTIIGNGDGTAYTPLDSSLFDTLKFRCPSLEQVSVGR